MKKLLFSLAFLMVFGLAFGQDGKTRERSEKEKDRSEQRQERRQEREARREARAQEKAEKAAEITKMTNEQKEVVLDIFRQEQARIMQIVKNSNGDVDLVKEDLKALQKQTNAKIKTIVGPEKYTHYDRWFQDSNQEQLLQDQVMQEEAGIYNFSEQEIRELKKEKRETNREAKGKE